MICWDSDQSGARPGINTFERRLSEPWVHVDQPEMRPSIPYAHSYHDQAIFGEEGHDIKYGQEDRSGADLFESSVGVGTSNVHDGRDDVRSSFGDVSVGMMLHQDSFGSMLHTSLVLQHRLPHWLKYTMTNLQSMKPTSVNHHRGLMVLTMVILILAKKVTM